VNAADPPKTLAAELLRVSVTFGSGAAAVRAVSEVSLQVRRGELLLLMGPSGSGKTTLLQILGCLRHPNQGEVRIEGQSVSGFDAQALSELRRKRIGFVFQSYNLIPTLRAWENVALALELQGQKGKALEHGSRQVLERVGLSARANAFPAELSGGEKQRVAVARAVVNEPDIILADEPTAALDAMSGSQIALLLANVAHEHGRAVVIVTHDARITGVADRIALLEDGRITSVRKNVMLVNKTLRERLYHEPEERISEDPDGNRHIGPVVSSG
jgi:putative ABC transport system ATP-binding protein